MKRNKLFCGLFLSMFAVLLAACSSDDSVRTLDFAIASNSLAIPEGRSSDIPIISGNGDYTLTIADKSIIEATFEDPADGSFGFFRVTGLKEGKTTLTIKDEVIRQTYVVNVNVLGAAARH